MIDELGMAWLAGLFEGEGCISIHGGGVRGYTVLTVAVSMTDRDAVAAFAERFGGKVDTLPRRNPRHRQVYEWRRRGGTAAGILREIAPYIRTPRVRAKIELAIEFSAAMRQGAREPGYRERLATFRPRMGALNARGEVVASG